MKRTELEKHLGKKVKITLFDKSTQTGILQKSENSKFYYCYLPRVLFRCSHVIKLEEA